MAAPLDVAPLTARHLPPSTDRLLAVGVAPAFRRQGLAQRLLGALVEREEGRDRQVVALFTPAERDPFAPLPLDMRLALAAELLARTGFRPLVLPDAIRSADVQALLAVRVGSAVPDGRAAAVVDALTGR